MKKLYFSILAFIILQHSLNAQKLRASEDSALVEVIVKDYKEHLRKHDQVIFEGQQTHVALTGTTDANGRFLILLPEGDIYDIKIKGLGENQQYNTFSIPKVKGTYALSTLTISYEPARKFTLKNLQFDSGKSSIRTGSDEILKELVELMKLKPEMVIEVGGHTDDIGDDLANEKLSQSRAEAVKQYLILKGKIPAARILAKGYGESRPIADNDREDGRQQNRRTEVIIIKE